MYSGLNSGLLQTFCRILADRGRMFSVFRRDVCSHLGTPFLSSSFGFRLFWTLFSFFQRLDAVHSRTSCACVCVPMSDFPSRPSAHTRPMVGPPVAHFGQKAARSAHPAGEVFPKNISARSPCKGSWPRCHGNGSVPRRCLLFGQKRLFSSFQALGSSRRSSATKPVGSGGKLVMKNGPKTCPPSTLRCL